MSLRVSCTTAATSEDSKTTVGYVDGSSVVIAVEVAEVEEVAKVVEGVAVEADAVKIAAKILRMLKNTVITIRVNPQ